MTDWGELPDYMTEEPVIQSFDKVTRVGLQLPDGSVVWADDAQVIDLQVGSNWGRYSLVTDAPERAVLVEALCQRARMVGFPEGLFVGMHHVVMQQFVNEVTVPQVVDTLVVGS